MRRLHLRRGVPASRRPPLVRLVLLVPLVVALSCGAARSADPGAAAGQGNATVAELHPEKARFPPGEPVELVTEVDGGDAGFDGPLTLRVYHLDEVVHEDTRTVSVAAGQRSTERFLWTPPPDDFTGYLAVASAGGSERTTGVDVSSSPYRFPRYGYLSDFSSAVSPDARAARVRVLAQRYLIDMLQLYDWQWRHEKALREEGGQVAGTWLDLFGREVVWQGVQDYVRAAHDENVAALAYVMLYAAREGYAEMFPVSPGWGIFASPGAENQLGVDFGNGKHLYLFDPGNRAWQDWIVSQYVDAVRRGGFDGVHVDQLGPRYGVHRADGSIVDLPSTFPDFLRETKRRLSAEVPEGDACIFNLVDGAVGGWAVQEVATGNPCDLLYSEIWFSANTYRDLRLYVEQLRLLGQGAAVVLAAYSQYGEEVGPIYEAEEARLEGVDEAADHPGYTGAGFVAGFDAPGDAITWEVSLPEDETVTLAFRYANATGKEASRHLRIDGKDVATLTFASDDQWSHWSPAPYFQVELAAGRHEVTLAFEADDQTAINVDHLRLSTFSEQSVRLADAVMFASGATHIELGDDEQSLAHEYYPNRSKSLTPELKRALRRYYAFAAAYENVLFGADVVPVREASAGLSIESGQRLSETGGGAVHPILRRRPGMDLIHLVNLVGVEDDLWRNAASAPAPQQDVRVRWRVGDREVASAFWASPDVDGGVPHPLEVTRGGEGAERWVEVTLPRLDYWDMVVVRYR